MQSMVDRWRMFVGYLAESTGYRNQRTFHVYIPEFLPTLTGDITPETATHKVDVENVITKKKESLNVQTSTTITAEYFGFLVSRTVPTMYKNQQVLVLNFANTDKFYWIPLERDDCLRTFEQIRYSALDLAQTNKTKAIGDDIEGKQAGITDDNSYFLEIDTKYHKHIKMQTAASDGEDFRYFFKMDANSKTVELYDKCIKEPGRPSNSIILESEPVPGVWGRIKIETAAGTSITMEHDCMKINVPKNLEIYVGNNLLSTVKGTTTAAFTKSVNTTLLDTFVHAGNGASTLKFNDNVGMTIQKMYGIVVKQNMTVAVTNEYSQQSAIRRVTVAGADMLDCVARLTKIRGYDQLDTPLASWKVAEMTTIFVVDIPIPGMSLIGIPMPVKRILTLKDVVDVGGPV